MYLGIDVGGTKTLVASLDGNGVITEEIRFPTPKEYDEFVKELTTQIKNLKTKEFKAGAIGIPGRVDSKHGVGLAFGNLDWTNIPICRDVERIANCPIAVENDANLAGLSEAMLVKKYSKVLYVTVSTGIGTGYIVDQKIDPALADSEGGQMPMEYHGTYTEWEEFASGRAIANRYNKPVREITDERSLRVIARGIAIGLDDLIAVLGPDVIVLGGSVGTYFEKYGGYLHEYLEAHKNPVVKIPPIQIAGRPEQAVVYGCYDLAKQIYG